MKIIYVADDGTQFDNEFECEDYEWQLAYKHINDVYFFDKDQNRLGDAFSCETYNKADIISVLNKDALQALHELADYTGFLSYLDVTECGIWTFNYDVAKFVKAE